MYRRHVDRRDERTSRTALRLAVIALAMASCTARYTYLVPAAQIARSHVAEGSFITLRTSRDEDRNVVIDALRSATPSAGDVTVYAAQRTWAPTAGLIPGAFVGAGFGALYALSRCFEGCTEPAPRDARERSALLARRRRVGLERRRSRRAGPHVAAASRHRVSRGVTLPSPTRRRLAVRGVRAPHRSLLPHKSP